MADHLPKNIRDTIRKLRNGANEEQRKLIDILDVSLGSMVPAVSDGMIHAESMVTSRERKPMVVMRWGNNKGELSPIEARQFALSVINAAEAAVQDAAIFDFMMTQSSNSKEQDGYRMIAMVRDHRRKFEDEQ